MPLAGKRLLVVDESEDGARGLAAAAVARGAEAVICAGGREALAEVDLHGAHAALVDLPLRDVRGDAFLVALRDRGVPCVAVSGVLRGPRFAETARELGALAFLEKPFDVEEVFRILEEAVRPAESGKANLPTPSPALPVVEGTAIRTSTPAPTPTSTPNQLTASTPAPASPPLDFDPEHPDFDSIIFSPARPALDEAVTGSPRAREGLSLPLPGQLAAPPARQAPGRPRLPEGDLATTRVPRLLAALHAAQATGALTLRREGVKKLLLFERGRPVFAVSNVPTERFGARAVRDGIVSAEHLLALLAESDGKTPAAEALVARGHISPGQRARMVREQICEILWNAFAWRDGGYRLLASALIRRPPVAVDLFPGDLVLEGLRRTLMLEAAQAELPPGLALAPGAEPAFQPAELTLAPWEAALLAHADGTKTVADLVLLSQAEERAALAFLLGCRELGLLDPVERALAGTRRIGFM